LLDDQRGCQDRAFEAAEALFAALTFPAAADTPVTIVRGINDFRIIALAVWATHKSFLRDGWEVANHNI
jgi:hypothetical protein